MFSKGLLNGTTHTAVGQEDIAYIMSQYIDVTRDKVFSNHRCHAHYLSITDDYHGLLAEIMGKRGGVCGGLGGSQHLCNRYFFSSGIQGSAFPIAAGCAHGMKLSLKKGKVIVYMGEGTFGQGLVYEVFNYATINKLPIIFIVEDNEISQSTPSKLTISGTIGARASAFGLDYLFVKKDKIFNRMKVVNQYLKKWEKRRLPAIIHFKTSRLKAHSKSDDTRSSQELLKLKQEDFLVELQDKFGKEVYQKCLNEASGDIKLIVDEVTSRKFETDIYYLKKD